MSLPAFNTPNINSYLQSIESNASAYSTLASDLQTNFLAAWQSRFTIPIQYVNAINLLKVEQRTSIISGFNQAASYLALNTSSNKKILADVIGVDVNPPPQIESLKVKVSIGVSYDTRNEKWKFELKVEVSCPDED